MRYGNLITWNVMRIQYLVLVLLLFKVETLCASGFYVYIDHNGHYSFSDRQPSKGKFEKKQAKQVITIKWKKSNKIKQIKKNKSNKKIKYQNTQPKYCQQLKNEIINVSIQLKSKLKALSFDQLKAKLSKIRWQYQKKCA